MSDDPDLPSASARGKPLRGVRVLSLALNLPGPAALLRLQNMGARCLKFEPPAPAGAPAISSADPMSQYSASAYASLHQGIKRVEVDLKSQRGQTRLQRELARTDVLLTSFRPAALARLGLAPQALRQRYPALSVVAIVGAPGARANQPGHDLTYLAQADLVSGLTLPTSLFADMAGALLASEAVLQAVLRQKTRGKNSFHQVALSAAADWLALPRRWGLTLSHNILGGAHAGYRVYPCQDGRVALAALEPHFAAALCAVAGLPAPAAKAMWQADMHTAVAAFLASKTRQQIDALAARHDLPLHVLPA